MNTLIQLSIFITLLSCNAERDSKQKFYGGDSVGVNLEFQSHFDVLKTKFSDDFDPQNPTLKKEDLESLNDALSYQVSHLFGVFTYHEKPFNFSAYSGSIKSTRKGTLLSIRNRNEKYYRIKYSYSGNAVFYDEILDWLDRGNKVSFYMPKKPYQIFNDTLPKIHDLDPVTKLPIHPCSNSKDGSYLAFYYYWSPDYIKCPQTFKTHLLKVTATLSKLPSTRKTFPEYEKLDDQDSPMEFSLIYGIDEKLNDIKDWGYLGFKYDFDSFTSQSRPGSYSEAVILRDEKHYKKIFFPNTWKPAIVHMYFTDPDSIRFVNISKKAFKESNLVLFEGHSADGYYFDPKRLFSDKRPLPKNLYQILFFNACSTYSYYGDSYFDLKKSSSDTLGTQNLDILLNVIGAAYVGVQNRKEKTSNYILINSLLKMGMNKRELKNFLSWQQILDKIADARGFEDTGLTVILGDEDNPTSPTQ